MNNNLILDTDSYKSSHYLQYPPGTTNQFSYVESRGGKYDRTVFFGLQYLLTEYLAKGITPSDVVEAAELFKAHGEPFNFEGWMYIATQLKGKLPLHIRAVPEGTVVPTHNVLMTVENTDPKCAFLTSYFETMLLRIWYPVTVATRSWFAKRKIRTALQYTADDLSGLPFKLHDFGSRGVTTREQAALGGAAHLVNFMGTDTVMGLVLLQKYYNEAMAGFSIPAAEHSTITAWGREGEVEAYRNMLNQFAKPGSIVAVVSDSYDIYGAVENIWGGTLRQQVIDSGATVVIRPDSGNPADVVSRLLQIMDAKFGSKTNSKGYKVLNNVRIIQGDGMDDETLDEVLGAVKTLGFSADNVAFGMGAGLLQKLNRDTQRFAYKCSSITVNGVEIPVQKAPIGDPGKWSKAGRLNLVKRSGRFLTVTDDGDSELTTVFFNGNVASKYTLKEIRERADSALDDR